MTDVKLPYSLNLHGSVKLGGRPRNVSNLLANWKRSIRRVGGFWTGTADYNLENGTLEDAKDLYLSPLMQRFTESVGGYTSWEGFLAETNLTLDGVTYTRSVTDMANALKVTYTRIGENLFTNGDVESAAWANEGSPTTNEQSTTWYTHGSYSAHCVTQAAPNDEGMEIQNTIAITAELAYECRVTVNVVSGTWVLKIKDQATDVTLAKAKSAGVGEDKMVARLDDDNAVTSVRVILIEKTAGSSGEIYADDAVLAIAPVKAETSWFTDTASQADYGAIEDILLAPQMTNAAASLLAQTQLKHRSWPRSLPPERLEVTEAAGKGNGLRLMFCGYAFTMNWQYLLGGGEANMDTHVTSLLGEAGYITAGTITTNATLFMIDEIFPLRIWDAIEEIIQAGDSSQNRWDGGVWAGRLFHYLPTPTTVQYHYSGGKLYDRDGLPVDPWLARPQLTRIVDMPAGGGEVSDDPTDDPRNIFLDEVEFSAPAGLSIRREVRHSA